MEIMSKEKEYKRRLKYISEDIKRISDNSSESFLSTPIDGYENIGTLISNIEIASNLKDKECLDWKTKFDIPTHDPQTGELNPYYEELTGKRNPLVDPNLVIRVEPRMVREDFKKDKDIDKMPNPKWHQIVSFIKSGVRIIGYCFIPFNLVVATILLVLSEIIGIVEEMV
jgi:hypothetical protein